MAKERDMTPDEIIGMGWFTSEEAFGADEGTGKKHRGSGKAWTEESLDDGEEDSNAPGDEAQEEGDV